MLGKMSEQIQPESAATPQPGELSADRRYQWDGHAWQLVAPQPPQYAAPAVAPVQAYGPQHVVMTAGTAFKFGFFAFFGAGCASIAFWIVLVIVLSLVGGLGAIGLGALGSHT
jgi:hypothetical protein